jgi:HK97 family phage prohead protease
MAQNFDQLLVRGLSGLIERHSRGDSSDGPVMVTGYASTVDEDIDGYVILPEAYRKGLAMYMRNPILLFNHDRDKPIGIVKRAEIDARGLLIDAEFDMEDDFSAARARQVERGILRGFSVGFRPTAEPKFKDDKLYFNEVQLMEISLVSVPANPHALIGAEAGELVARAAQAHQDALKEIAAAESKGREAVELFFKDQLKGAERRVAELFEARGFTVAALVEKSLGKQGVTVEDDEITRALRGMTQRIDVQGGGQQGGGNPLPPDPLNPPPTPIVHEEDYILETLSQAFPPEDAMEPQA